MTSKKADAVYLEKAQNLSQEDTERMLSRLSGKLPKKLSKDKISELEAIALQLEIEDEQLSEWREKMHAIKSKEAKDSIKNQEVKKK